MPAHVTPISDDPLKEKLLGYLAADVSQAAAALACGVSDGYVSQCLEEAEFLNALAVRRAGKLEKFIKHDETVESLEQRALDVLGQKLPFVRTATEAAKVYQILNSSKKHATPDQSTADALGAQQVTITLPRAAAVQIQLNPQRQVIEVNGRSMATLPSRSLPALSTLTAAKTLETSETLKTKDINKAAQILDNTEVHKTIINGVVKVL
jgi:hypothetical protein